jgi:hypothetical protein
MARVGISMAGALFVAYLYVKVMLAGYPLTIPFLDVIVSL